MFENLKFAFKTSWLFENKWSLLFLFNSKCSLVLFSAGKEIVRGNAIQSGLTVGPEYNIRFKIFPTSYSSGWHNIIHFTKGKNWGVSGSRVPAVWAHESRGNFTSRSLHICADVNDDPDLCFDTKRIPKNTWTFVNIKQELMDGSYMYKILINDSVVYSVENKSPKTFRNVIAYASDPWSPAQNGYLRELMYAVGM